MFVISACAPSALSMRDWASSALRMAMFVDAISAERREAIEVPAASSLAEIALLLPRIAP
jgi:hypothetical protein